MYQKWTDPGGAPATCGCSGKGMGQTIDLGGFSWEDWLLIGIGGGNHHHFGRGIRGLFVSHNSGGELTLWTLD